MYARCIICQFELFSNGNCAPCVWHGNHADDAKKIWSAWKSYPSIHSNVHIQLERNWHTYAYLSIYPPSITICVRIKKSCVYDVCLSTVLYTQCTQYKIKYTRKYTTCCVWSYVLCVYCIQHTVCIITFKYGCDINTVVYQCVCVCGAVMVWLSNEWEYIYSPRLWKLNAKLLLCTWFQTLSFTFLSILCSHSWNFESHACIFPHRLSTVLGNLS